MLQGRDFENNILRHVNYFSSFYVKRREIIYKFAEPKFEDLLFLPFI